MLLGRLLLEFEELGPEPGEKQDPGAFDVARMSRAAVDNRAVFVIVVGGGGMSLLGHDGCVSVQTVTGGGNGVGSVDVLARTAKDRRFAAKGVNAGTDRRLAAMEVLLLLLAPVKFLLEMLAGLGCFLLLESFTSSLNTGRANVGILAQAAILAKEATVHGGSGVRSHDALCWAKSLLTTK